MRLLIESAPCLIDFNAELSKFEPSKMKVNKSLYLNKTIA
jgi:hypothetical protein